MDLLSVSSGRHRKNYLVLNQEGQTLVEYIMLMGMIAFLIFTVFNSDIFKEFFGPEGTFSTNFRQEIEYSYWHTHQGREFFTRPNYQSFNHPSYLGGGGTRFFTTSQPYP